MMVNSMIALVFMADSLRVIRTVKMSRPMVMFAFSSFVAVVSIWVLVETATPAVKGGVKLYRCAGVKVDHPGDAASGVISA